MLLSTSGGFDAHPLISEVLLQRALKVSRSPAQETVILLGHGARNDEDNQFWIEQMDKLAELFDDEGDKGQRPSPHRRVA